MSKLALDSVGVNACVTKFVLFIVFLTRKTNIFLCCVHYFRVQQIVRR